MTIDAPDKTPRSFFLLAAAGLFAAATLLMAIRARSTLASFREIFAGFGATVPPTTMLVLNAPYVWWLLAAASVALFAWVATKPQVDGIEHKRMKLALGVIVALAVLAYGFASYWLYLPIFKLGAVV